jgi:hypothetical protein
MLDLENKMRDPKASNRKATKKYYWKNIEARRKYYREHQCKVRRETRLKIIKALGGECVKCGIKDKRVLQVDHINGGGCKELRLIDSKLGRYKYAKKIIAQAKKGKYQLLCANCNWIKRFENGEEGRTFAKSKKNRKNT